MNAKFTTRAMNDNAGMTDMSSCDDDGLRDQDSGHVTTSSQSQLQVDCEEEGSGGGGHSDIEVSGHILRQNSVSAHASLCFESGGGGNAPGSGTSVAAASVNNATGKKGLRNAAGWLKQVLIT